MYNAKLKIPVMIAMGLASLHLMGGGFASMVETFMGSDMIRLAVGAFLIAGIWFLYDDQI